MMLKLPKQMIIDEVENAILKGSRRILVMIRGNSRDSAEFMDVLAFYLGSKGTQVEIRRLRKELTLLQSGVKISVFPYESSDSTMAAHHHAGATYETVIFNEVMTFHHDVVQHNYVQKYLSTRIRSNR